MTTTDKPHGLKGRRSNAAKQNPRSKRITVMLSGDDLEILQKAADHQGCPVSVYMREMALGAAKYGH